MGIFKKIGGLARANINAWLSQIEDRKKLAEQKILDLEASKKKAHKLLVSAMAAVKLAEQHKLRIKRNIEMQSKAGPLKPEKRDVLNEEQEALIEESKTCDEAIEKEQQTISTINQGLKAIDEQITIIKNTSSSEIAQKIIENDDALSTFSRMEEKIDVRESEVEALEELLAMSDKNAKKSSAFDKHSDPTALEDELTKIKKKFTK